ncbi:hypothetical protein BLOT_014012, partial [Blomia tropicalis]
MATGTDSHERGKENIVSNITPKRKKKKQEETNFKVICIEAERMTEVSSQRKREESESETFDMMSEESSENDEITEASSYSEESSESEEEREEKVTQRKRKKTKQKSKGKKQRIKGRKTKVAIQTDDEVPIYHVSRIINSFDGNMGEWPNFKRQVQSLLITREKESDELKKAVIFGLLKGEAKSVWGRSQSSNPSLDKCWAKLKKTYENPKRVNSFVAKTIIKMRPVKDIYDLDGLQAILDQVTEFQSAITNLGTLHKLNQTQLVYDIASKFWIEERQKMGTRYNDIKSLLRRIRKLYDNAINYIHSGTVKATGASQKVSKPNYFSIANVQTMQGNQRKCRLCQQEGHVALVCETTMTEQDKIKAVLDQGLCFSCLRPSHNANECRSKGLVRCRYCMKSHPTSLHGVSFGKKLPEPSNIVTVGSVQGPTGKNIGAFVARIGNHQCEILIDSGAEVSVISIDLVNVVQIKKVAPILLLGFETRMSSIVDSVAEIVLIHAKGHVQLEAYVSSHVPRRRLIVGRDHLAKLFREGHKVWHTIFGDVDLETMCGVNSIARAAVPWYSSDLPEDVDPTKLDMKLERLGGGRFEVSLPFFSTCRPRDNFQRVVMNLEQLQRRLRRENLFEEYESELFKFVQQGHAEIINERKGYFLPHREILRPSAVSTKFRIVLNASFGKDSLNQLLWKGTMSGLNTLPHLLRIRSGKYLVTADLQQAFLQIIIKKEDRSFLRFLWKNKEGQLIIMQMIVLPFGVICAPAILTQVVNVIVSELSPPTRAIVQESTYMDDMLAVSDSEGILLAALTETKHAFNQAGFKLHKINSNSGKIRQEYAVSTEDCHVLGIRWNCITDTLNLAWQPGAEIASRRALLQFIGQCYDPLGIAEPVKLPLRVMFSELLALDWDQTIDYERKIRIDKVRSKLHLIAGIKLPRYVHGRNLLCFVDACFIGYGYVIYRDQDIVFGKSKIAPKRRTIVDLELLALLEGMKAIDRIIREIKFEGDIHVFTDSQVNVERLKKSPNDFAIVIARRLMEILTIGAEVGAKFYHVAGGTNPADLFSRGCSIGVYQRKQPWTIEPSKYLSLTPIRTKIICNVRVSKRKDPIIMAWLDRKGTFKAMVKSVQQLMKWKRLIKSRDTIEDGWTAEKATFYLYQQASEKQPAGLVEIDGLLRYVTRTADYQPIWIPQSCQLAENLLKDAHRKSLHRGVQMSMAMMGDEIRVAGAARLLKSIIKKCVICRAIRGKMINQPLGHLHDNQQRYVQPFEDIVTDMFGPIKLSNGTKSYGLIVVCRSTKAVKIQVVPKQTAEDLQAALLTIWRLVGWPNRIHSDNGANYMAVRSKLLAHKPPGSPEFVWTTSTPYGPWMNGLAERLVRTSKECLVRVSQPPHSHHQLQQRFQYIEFIVNSRPILQNDGRLISAFELFTGRPMHIRSSGNQLNPLEWLQQRSAKSEEWGRLWISRFVRQLPRSTNKEKTEIKVGDWVMIPKMMSQRAKWPVGQVIGVKYGRDDVCRSVKIRSEKKELWRPTNGLIRIAQAQAGTVAIPVHDFHLRGIIDAHLRRITEGATNK